MNKKKTESAKKILLVDDDNIIRKILGHSLVKAGFSVTEAKNGDEGLKSIQKEIPDLVITDLQMPIMNGMELMAKINQLMLPVPVIVITGNSRVEDVIHTLRLGVRDFIRKPFDSSEMITIINKVLHNPYAPGSEDELIPYVQKESKIVILPNDTNVLNLASFYLTRNLPQRGFCTQIEKENIRHALLEALTNAMMHGNLELNSDLKLSGQLSETGFHALMEERLKQKKFNQRQIKATYRFTGNKVLYRIEDQGPGFNYHNLPDPLHPDNIFKPYGRGIFFIRLHMDKVFWNDQGNTLTMIRFRDRKLVNKS